VRLHLGTVLTSHRDERTVVWTADFLITPSLPPESEAAHYTKMFQETEASSKRALHQQQ
jgi:hypothetical protein